MVKRGEEVEEVMVEEESGRPKDILYFMRHRPSLEKIQEVHTIQGGNNYVIQWNLR